MWKVGGEDVYMKRKSIYSILSWYKSDVLGPAHDNTVFAHEKDPWLFSDTHGIKMSRVSITPSHAQSLPILRISLPVSPYDHIKSPPSK
jgi:hypothetical protein